MPYGGSPYGGGPYGGSASAESGYFIAGDLEDEGELGEPNYEGQSLNEYQAGDLTDPGDVGYPLLDRNWGPNSITPFPTVAPAQVEANGETFPELAFEVVEHFDHSHVAWLPLVIEQKVRGARDDPGGISLTLAHKDPALASVTYGRMLRAWLRGQLIATSLIEPRNDTTLAPNEHQQRASIGGRGSKAYLEQVTIGPVFDGNLASDSFAWWPDTQTHRHNWAHPLLSTSHWPLARSKSRQGVSSPHWTGYPRSWPDPLAHWMSGVSGDRYSAPAGNSYFTIDFLTNAADHALFFTGDNSAEVWIDGVELGNSGDWQSLTQHDVKMSAGVHRFRAKVYNRSSSGPSALLVVLREMSRQGRFITTQLRTQPTILQPIAPALWRCLQYPASPPAWTPGQIIRYHNYYSFLRAIGEGLGPVPNVITTFTDTHDSAGRVWPFIPDFSVPVGNSLFQLVTQLEESYIDTEMTPGSWTLHAWVKGTQGRPVDFDEQVNLAHRSTPPLATTLLIRYADNWAMVSITPPAGFRRVEAMIKLPQVKTEAMAEEIGMKVLENFGHERVEYKAELAHDSDYLPPISMRERDRIPLPNRAGVDQTVGITAWELSMDKNGKIAAVIEAGDRILHNSEALAQWLERMADGAMYGDTAQASPQLLDTYAVPKRTRQFIVIPYQRDADVEVLTSHPYPVDNFSILVDAQARLGTGESVRGSDTDCIINIDGVPIGTCTIPAGSSTGRVTDFGNELERDQDVTVTVNNIGFSLVIVLRFT